ncbi:MAG: Ribosomal silencing factor RsfA, partial [uncultured Thermomicrobiales bacterium]
DRHPRRVYRRGLLRDLLRGERAAAPRHQPRHLGAARGRRDNSPSDRRDARIRLDTPRLRRRRRPHLRYRPTQLLPHRGRLEGCPDSARDPI